MTRLFLCLTFFACTVIACNTSNTEIADRTAAAILEETKPTTEEIHSPTAPNLSESITIEPSDKEKTITSTITPKKSTNKRRAIEPVTTSYQFNDIKALRDELGVEPVSFTVDPSKTQTLTGPQGTKLYIPENAFVDLEGNLVEGEITIRMKECYTPASWYLEKLATFSGEKELETGGMLHLEATKDGEEVVLQKEIGIDMPTKDKKEGMELFLGEEKEGKLADWRLNKCGTKPYPVIYCTEIPWGHAYVDEFKVFFEENRDFSKEQLLGLVGKSFQLSISFDIDGNPIGSTFGNGDYQEISEWIYSLADEMPKPKFNQQRWHESFTFDVRMSDEIAPEMTSFDTYRFYTPRMGWINCDRFGRRAPKADLRVPKEKNAEEEFLLIYQNQVKPLKVKRQGGETFYTTKATLNIQGMLVATKIENGQVYLAKKSVSPQEEVPFEVTTLDYEICKDHDDLMAKVEKIKLGQ